MTRLPRDVSDAQHPELTSRELQVVQLMARRRSTTQIAAAMSITVNTVRTRAHHAERKLGAVSRDEATQTARDRGII